MVEFFGLPTAGRVAAGAVGLRRAARGCLNRLSELAAVNVLVAPLALERQLDELVGSFSVGRLLVAFAAGDLLVASFQWHFRLSVIE